MKSNTPESAKHPDELLLLYAENMLAPDQKIKVESHLKECEECSSSVRALRETISSLKDAREIFCPEPWDIYEFVERGKPEGAVSRHLGLCASCRAEAASYETASIERMPVRLWKSIQERVPSVSEMPRTEEETTFCLVDRLLRWFRSPAIAVGAAVAAILLVFVFYPRDFIQPGVGLTSVTWEDALKPKGIQNKVAVLLLFKDFKQRMPQARIDSIYETLKPDMNVSERFNLVSPAALSAAIKNREVDARDDARLLSSLHNKFDVSLAVLVKISPAGNAFDVNVSMIDAVSGKTIQTTVDRNVPEIRLNEKVHEAVENLLLREK